MSLQSLLARLHRLDCDVSAVSGVQASHQAALHETAVPAKSVSAVSGRARETFETAAGSPAVSAEPAPALACTSETSETARFQNAWAQADAARNPDRWRWPASSAMNSSENDAMFGRIARFIDQGLTLDEAERLADTLMLRDREQDDRRICLECRHMSGTGPRSWRCGNWQRASVAHRFTDAGIGRDIALLLQRCDGFARMKL